MFLLFDEIKILRFFCRVYKKTRPKKQTNKEKDKKKKENYALKEIKLFESLDSAAVLTFEKVSPKKFHTLIVWHEKLYENNLW